MNSEIKIVIVYFLVYISQSQVQTEATLDDIVIGHGFGVSVLLQCEPLFIASFNCDQWAAKINLKIKKCEFGGIL